MAVNLLPPYLFRIQHMFSFAVLDQHGFLARGNLDVKACHLINRERIEKHLNGKDRSDQHSPFISLLQGVECTFSRAQTQVEKHGDMAVRVMTINTKGLQRTVQMIEFDNGTVVRLPVWINGSDLTLFSVLDAAKSFDLNMTLIDPAEWLAIGEIPCRFLYKTVEISPLASQRFLVLQSPGGMFEQYLFDY